MNDAAPLTVTHAGDGADVPIHGHCDPAFCSVQTAFEENFRARGELGAAVAVYKDGVKVVDLWGGHKDVARSVPWEADTLVTTASVVKGMMAIALHMLAEQGRISYDAPVAAYWPEFAAAGKQAITVRQLISHHAAVHFIDAAQPGDYFRWENMVAAIAQQKPEWPAATRGAYHTVSIIFILGKLIQAASGELPWDYFRREVTEKLGVDYNLRMTDADVRRFTPDLETEHFIKGAGIAPDVMARFFAGMGNPGELLAPAEVMKLANQVSSGTARGVARLFAFLANDGTLDGVKILSPRTIDLATAQQWHEPCAVWGMPMRMGLGLLLNEPEFFYIGPNDKAFGTAGGGGSFGMADRQNRLSVGYALNSWWPALALGDRARAVIDSVYAAL